MAMPLGSRGSFSSIARRRCQLTPARSRHRPPARSCTTSSWRYASSGDVKDKPPPARRRAPRTSAPLPSRQTKPTHRPSTSSANRRPASALPRADAQHRRHARQASSFPQQSAPAHSRSKIADQCDPRGSQSCQQSHLLSRLKRRPFSRPILSHIDRTSRTNSIRAAGGERQSAYVRRTDPQENPPRRSHLGSPTRSRYQVVHRSPQRRSKTLPLGQISRRNPRSRQTILPKSRRNIMWRTLDSGE